MRYDRQPEPMAALAAYVVVVALAIAIVVWALNHV
jgi:hypothetical protein